jgi:hypothetical protein
MDAIARRDGRAIKDFYDELRRVGLTMEQGPLGPDDITKLIGEPKGIVPKRPSMGESLSSPPKDPRDFKAYVDKMMKRAAELEDSRVGYMSPVPTQLPVPREGGPYGGGFSTFPPYGDGYWEKGPGGRGVWVEKKLPKGMKEYNRLLRKLQQLMGGLGPIDAPTAMYDPTSSIRSKTPQGGLTTPMSAAAQDVRGPAGRAVPPPVDPLLLEYQKTGQRAFPTFLRAPEGTPRMSTKRAVDLAKWSKLAFGTEMGRSRLFELYSVLATTPPNRLRKLLMDPKTPQWLKDTIETWRLHKRKGVPQFPDTLKRAIGRLRTLEKAEAVKGAPKAMGKLAKSGWLAVEGLPEVVEPPPLDPAAVARAEKSVGMLQKAIDKRKAQGISSLGHRARAAAEEELIGSTTKKGKLAAEELYAMSQSGMVPGGAFGELPKDFDKLRGMARVSMGEPAIGPLTQSKQTQELLRAAILGGYTTTPGGDVVRRHLVKALAQGELTSDMVEKELEYFSKGKTRTRAAKYGIDVPAEGERIFDDEPRRDVEKRARRSLARDLSDSHDRKITQLLKAEAEVDETMVRAYGKSRIAMERGEDWLSSQKGVDSVLGDAKWRKLTPRDKRAKLTKWSEGFTEERLERLKRIRNYGRRLAPKYRPPAAGEVFAPAPPQAPRSWQGLPLWRGLVGDPGVPYQAPARKITKAEAIGGGGAKVMIREIERLLGGKTVYRRKRVPKETRYRPFEIGRTRLPQPRVRKPLGPAKLPKPPPDPQRTFTLLYQKAAQARLNKPGGPRRRARTFPKGEVLPLDIPRDPMSDAKAMEQFRKRLRMFSKHGKGIFGKASPKPPTPGWTKVQQIIKILARMPK